MIPRRRAISIRQPYAELIASGRKTIEARKWPLNYRGPLVICSAAQWHTFGVRHFGRLGDLGVQVCEVEVTGCRPLTVADAGAACWPGLTAEQCEGWWAIELSSPRRMPPAPVKGQCKIFWIGDRIEGMELV